MENGKMKPAAKVTSIGYTIRTNMRQYAMLIALIVIMIFFQIATDGVLLVPMNVTNLILQNSYVLILAIGMTLCILTGGNIDLSVGSVAAFTAAIVGTLVINKKMDVTLALTIGLLIGAVIGSWQGFWIAYVRIPPFIATLAGMLIFRGLTNTILKGLTLSPFPRSFQKISSGYIPDIFPNLTNLNMTPIVIAAVSSLLLLYVQIRNRKRKFENSREIMPRSLFVAQLIIVILAINLFALALAAHKGLPIILVILGVLIFVYHFFK